MNKVKVLTGAVIFLFLLNLGLMFFIMGSKHPPMMGGGPRNEIIETLEFDDEQKAEFAKIIQLHQENIISQDRKIIALKKELYNGLIDDEVETDSLFSFLAKEQVIVEKMHYNHFQELKELCRPDQKDNFEELTIRLAELFANRNRRNRPPRRGLTLDGDNKIE